MKKTILSMLVIAAMFSASMAYAASDNVAEGMAKKFTTGVINTFTGWIELPAQIIKGYNNGFMDNEDNKVVGVIVGFFSGLSHATGRTLSGVSDIAGFWAANQESNEGIGFPLDAQYAWEEGEKYNMFEPSFKEGAVNPVGKKLGHGLANTFLGIAEIPGQIKEGAEENEVGMGILKGFWYFFSREIDGLTDIFTAILPVPKETQGVAFDEEWPWQALTEKD